MVFLDVGRDDGDDIRCDTIKAGTLMLLREPKNQSNANLLFLASLEQYWQYSAGGIAAKLENFPKYTPREAITKFLARAAVFQMQLEIHGSIVELGVARGASLFTWAHLSSILEPANYIREIIGFDTFCGIPILSSEDRLSDRVSDEVRVGGFGVEPNMKADLERAASLHDLTRYLGHIPKIRLIEGDIENTLVPFLNENPQLVISLLHVDLDIYRPTKCALETLLPRMPKGGIIVFDELNNRSFPGETVAVHDALGIPSLALRRLAFCPALSYAIV